MKYEIRKIKENDNFKIKDVLISVMREFDVPENGTALADPELDDMFGSYQNPRSIYFVVIVENQVLGGAGVNALKGLKRKLEHQLKNFHLNTRIILLISLS